VAALAACLLVPLRLAFFRGVFLGFADEWLLKIFIMRKSIKIKKKIRKLSVFCEVYLSGFF